MHLELLQARLSSTFSWGFNPTRVHLERELLDPGQIHVVLQPHEGTSETVRLAVVNDEVHELQFHEGASGTRRRRGRGGRGPVTSIPPGAHLEPLVLDRLADFVRASISQGYIWNSVHVGRHGLPLVASTPRVRLEPHLVPLRPRLAGASTSRECIWNTISGECGRPTRCFKLTRVYLEPGDAKADAPVIGAATLRGCIWNTQ